MKIVVFTSNAIRHKFIANILSTAADDTLVITECQPNDALKAENKNEKPTLTEAHFLLRYETEKRFFPGNDFFFAKTIPLLYREINTSYVYETVKAFNPEAMFVFGSSIIGSKLLLLPPPGRFINLHLGLSPYYRGSGTNFWPFVNEEPEYAGSTLLHIDTGIDTGDIIAHIRPIIVKDDNVHTVGCKIIQESADSLVKILKLLKEGKELPRIKQWKEGRERYYKKADWNESVLASYLDKLEHGLIDRYLARPKKNIQLVSL